MQDGITRKGTEIFWMYKGRLLRIPREDARLLSQEFARLLPEVDLAHQQQLDAWHTLYALDSKIREQCASIDANSAASEQSLRWLFEHIVLQDGQYVPISSTEQWRAERWSQFWELIAHLSGEWIEDLWREGAFDTLIRHAKNLTVQKTETLLSSRLRHLTEAMQWMPAGEFQMGDESMEAWDFEGPIHTVKFTQGCWVGTYPVTQQLYWSVMQDELDILEQDRGAMKPAVGVSWWDALIFCNRLSLRAGRQPAYLLKGEPLLEQSQLKGLLQGKADRKPCIWDREANGYRLLTEAEWECAARGWQEFAYSGSDNSEEVAWTSECSVSVLQNIGCKSANALELFDMSGLVWEWCWDRYDSTFYHHSPSQDPIGPQPAEVGSAQEERVCRGGSFLGDESNARVSLRGRFVTTERWRGLGFRIACAE